MSRRGATRRRPRGPSAGRARPRSGSARGRDGPGSRDGRRARGVLPRISQEMAAAYAAHGDLDHLTREDLPSKPRTIALLNDLLTILFPSLSGDDVPTDRTVRRLTSRRLRSLRGRLEEEVLRSLRSVRPGERRPGAGLRPRAREVADALLEQLPAIKRRLVSDLRAAYEDDPAATSLEEVVLAYPCLYAIATYRLAHELYARGVPLIPRIMSEHAHTLTGIDIHPGARIGENFFIDHGTGVVIGETTEIGNNVRIYQGVTLGARSLSHAEVEGLRGRKRHPTIEDDVVIYSGATILGGETVIGKGAVIGGNVWITSSIPARTTVTTAAPLLQTQAG